LIISDIFNEREKISLQAGRRPDKNIWICEKEEMEGVSVFLLFFRFSGWVARTDNERIQDLGESLGLCKQLS
jgi:hypothetical protein